MEKAIINEEIFKKIINGAKASVAVDDTRPILKYIKLVFKDNNVTAYSCSGFTASRITLQLGESQDNFECLIKPINIKVSKGGLQNIVIEKEEDNVRVFVPTEFGKLVYNFSQPSGSFVDVERVFNDAEEHDREIALNIKYLKQALTAIGTTDVDNIVKIQTKADNTKAIIIKSNNGGGINNEQLILPVRLFDR